ncbi:NERD domain-containing protein [Macrococcoides canis]|uniref:nuclease-related domain-containing protein n=1 Tax=Macrococcoides canis TaxID=1855823 RepID=UPI00105F0625|nr:nuclease-related domain-containing protein [Macrococcus canis]TDM42827.1 NERD domain-containing protein [Macrococcus canis]
MQFIVRIPSQQVYSFMHLKHRYHFNDTNVRDLEKKELGYIGEVIADELIHAHFGNDPCIYLTDLNYIINYTQVQIDSILIIENTLYIFEVKYFNFDLTYDGELYYLANGEVLHSLNNQLEKIKKLMRSVFEYKVDDIIVKPFFTNKDQKIYSKHANHYLTMHNYKAFFNSIEKPKFYNQAVAAELIQMRKPNDFDKPLEIRYHEVEKGTYCPDCFHKLEKSSERKYQCTQCDKIFTSRMIIEESFTDLPILFPNIVITTPLLYDWFGGQMSDRNLRRYLKMHKTEHPFKLLHKKK